MEPYFAVILAHHLIQSYAFTVRCLYFRFTSWCLKMLLCKRSHLSMRLIRLRKTNGLLHPGWRTIENVFGTEIFPRTPLRRSGRGTVIIPACGFFQLSIQLRPFVEPRLLGVSYWPLLTDLGVSKNLVCGHILSSM